MVERRLKWLALVVMVWGVVIFYKLISLQVFHHQEYVRMARARQERDKEIPAPRGAILDRNGQVLAMSTPAVSVFVNPMKVPDLGIAAQTLPLPRHLAVALGVGPRAVRIGEIEPNGPADQAGMKTGDILVAMEGQAVTGADDLIRLLGADKIGRPVEFTVLRGGRLERMSVTPRERR